MMKSIALAAAGLMFATAGGLATSAEARPGAHNADVRIQLARIDRRALATPRINRRIANQSRRIRRGFRTGTLTRGETRRFNRRLNRIRALRARARFDGIVTRFERRRMLDRLNRLSRRLRSFGV